MWYSWGVPVIATVFMATYTFLSLRVAYKRAGTQHEASTPQSERAYKAFEFFQTVSIALVAGVGYVRMSVMQADPSLARQAMIGLAALQFVTSSFLVIAVAAHLGSKWERWEMGVKITEWWRWVEPWMMIIAYGVAAALWVVAVKW